MEQPLDLRQLITGIVRSVSESQNEMDRNSIKTAIRLHKDGLTDQLGLKARWYAIPEVELILKILLEISNERELKSQMVDASYVSKYNVDTSITSDFKLKIKRVPTEQDQNLTVHTEADVVSKVSRLREVALRLHRYSNCFLNVFYRKFKNEQSYTGGYWNIEIVHPPEVTSKQVSGLILSALIIVDDESGDIITAKYYDS